MVELYYPPFQDEGMVSLMVLEWFMRIGKFIPTIDPRSHAIVDWYEMMNSD